MSVRLSKEAPAPTINELEWSLLGAKHAQDEETYYSNHGHGRGGIGHLVATGGARSGVKRLPMQSGSRALAQSARPYNSARCSDRGALLATTRSTNSTPRSTVRSSSARPATITATAEGLQTAGSEDVVYNDWGDTSYRPTSSTMRSSSATPMVARHEWEKGYPHPVNFQAATRQVRIHDVAPSSKWASMSFFENDPQEIKRHLNICNILDQIHATAKGHELRDEKVRHGTWATRQREVFRRQRQESANKYNRSGLRLRDTYIKHPPVLNGDYEAQEGVLNYTSSSSSLPSERPPSVGHAAKSMNFSATGVNCTSGALYQTFKSAAVEGIPVHETVSTSALPPTISLPKPSFFKVHDRMINDSEESVTGRVHAHQKKIVEKGNAKERMEAAKAVQMLDEFEDQMRSSAKSRRGSYVEDNSGSEVGH